MLRAHRWLTVALVGGLVVLLQYPLANRKALLTSAILIAAALYVYFYLGRVPWRRAAGHWHLALGLGVPALLYAGYVALTLALVLDDSSQAFQSQAPSAPAPAVVRPVERGQVGLAMAPTKQVEKRVEKVFRNRARAVAAYTAIAPLTRTSISALVYPAIFPRLVPYYRLDVGVDILGYGSMPDDNLVVYRILWPEHHRGSITSPFHFVLYSQGGLAVALAGAVAVGILVGAGWVLIVRQPRMTAAAAVLGGVLVTFAVFLAIDSARNSVIVSYGLAWALPVIALLALSERLAGRADAAR
jgi:hypothetical protein